MSVEGGGGHVTNAVCITQPPVVKVGRGELRGVVWREQRVQGGGRQRREVSGQEGRCSGGDDRGQSIESSTLLKLFSADNGTFNIDPNGALYETEKV